MKDNVWQWLNLLSYVIFYKWPFDVILDGGKGVGGLRLMTKNGGQNGQNIDAVICERSRTCSYWNSTSSCLSFCCTQLYSGTSVYVRLGLGLFQFTYGDLSNAASDYVHSSEKFALQQVRESSEGVWIQHWDADFLAPAPDQGLDSWRKIRLLHLKREQAELCIKCVPFY